MTHTGREDLTNYYSAAQSREMDRIAIEELGIPGFTLMRRAGKAAFEVLRTRWPRCPRVVACCGTGNNGGDGFVIAALAREAGLDVDVFLLGDVAALAGDARRAFELAEAHGVQVRDAGPVRDFAGLPEGSVLVDALLGTGLRGEVRPDGARLIAAINAGGLPVLAVDIPSGLCSDTGRVLGSAVRAQATVTFIARKAGQVRGAGPAHCGQLYYDDLGVPAQVLARFTPIARA